MISKKDSKPILVKFPIGVNDGSSREMLYGEDWTTVYALISDPRGAIRRDKYGNELQFDKVITMNAGSVTRRITYDTLVMLDDMPTSNYKKGDYYIKYIFPEYNGEIVIGLVKQEAVKMPRLYFAVDDTILYIQLNLDLDSMTAYISNKQILPFGINDKVWTRKPASVESTEYAYTLDTRTNVGFDDRYKPFLQLTFVEVEDGE